jgi:glycosyltransferase involved in cell wall biosynthesis
MVRQQSFDVIVEKTALDWVSVVRDAIFLVLLRRQAPVVVLQLHGGSTEWLVQPRRRVFKLLTRIVLSLCDGVLVLAQEQRRELESFRPTTVVRVVSNPFVPTPTPAPTSASEAPVVLFASRIMRAKGIFETLEATAALKEKLPFRLVVAGSGPDAEAVASRVTELDVSDRVSLVGHLSGSELAEAYARAAIFVLPTYHPEGFPTAVAEAMGAGLPLVVTRNRGLVDHLQEGVNALFVPETAPNDLADALERLLVDRELRETMGAANRAKVQDFLPAPVARGYLDALRDIVSQARRH